MSLSGPRKILNAQVYRNIGWPAPDQRASVWWLTKSPLASWEDRVKVFNAALGVRESAGESGCSSCHVATFNTPLAAELREIVLAARREVEAPASRPDDSREITLSVEEPLPFVAELHHEEVEGHHAWVGVREGAIAVFDRVENDVVRRLVNGAAPLSIASTPWEEVANIVGKLGAAGLIRGLTGYRERSNVDIHRFSRMHLTRACQLECVHCYSDSSPRVDRSNELPTDRWLQYVEDFAAIGGERVLFTGGEALLHEGCVPLMAAAHDAGLHVTLFSNGIRVRRLADEIAACVDEVQISMDGPDAESNDAVRGRNTFNHITRAIDALAASGTRTRIGMTVFPSTWRNWAEKFSLVRDRYANYPNIIFKLSYGVMPYGRGVTVDPTRQATKAEIDAFLIEVNGDNGPQITRSKSGCGYAEQIVVGPDGGVHPCHLLDGAICHLDDMPLIDIVRLLHGIVREVDVDHIEGCRTCEIRYLCGGNCRVVSSQQTGSRLVTNCTPAEKQDKYRNLVRSFASAV
jgi:radical SAM protein with 4Fe4S-binding SPASM domain